MYRQSAGPDVDAAWEALGVGCEFCCGHVYDPTLSLWTVRSVVISESEAERSGLRRDQVKISEEYGGGFPVNLEGLHHLHCLVRLEFDLIGTDC